MKYEVMIYFRGNLSEGAIFSIWEQVLEYQKCCIKNHGDEIKRIRVLSYE